MKQTLGLVVTCLVLVAVTGCIPEKRIAWSPDGERAAVMAEGGIYIIDANGKLLPPHLAASSARCEWFPDGRRILVKHTISTQKWDDIVPLFSAEELSRIQTEAQSLRDRILAFQGDWKQFELDPNTRFAPGSEVAILLCLRNRFSEGLPEKLGAQWIDLEKINADIINLQIFTLTSAELQAGPTLLRTLNPVSSMRVSPDGKHVAFVMPTPEGTAHPPSLHVLPVDGGPARLVASNVAAHFDWRPDSLALAYIASSAPGREEKESVRLGTLATITVAGPGGELLDKWIEQNDRLGLLFNDRLTVRWLSDGRLFFSSVEVTLPATTRDMPQQWSLFAFDPRMPAGIIRVLGRDFDGPLDSGLPLFLLSPDEKRVLLPGPKGAITLYEIATGTTTPVAGPDERDDKLRSLPSWRNDSEICFVGPVPSEGNESPQLQVLLWKDGKTRSLSDAWPKETKEGWVIPAGD
jgi:hypothetical protein